MDVFMSTVVLSTKCQTSQSTQFRSLSLQSCSKISQSWCKRFRLNSRKERVMVMEEKANQRRTQIFTKSGRLRSSNLLIKLTSLCLWITVLVAKWMRRLKISVCLSGKSQLTSFKKNLKSLELTLRRLLSKRIPTIVFTVCLFRSFFSQKKDRNQLSLLVFLITLKKTRSSS